MTHAQTIDEAKEGLHAVARALHFEANRLGLSSAAQVELAAHLVDDALRILQGLPGVAPVARLRWTGTTPNEGC